jgi:hypothetical protein
MSKHRKFQLVITIGVVISAMVAILDASFQSHAMVIGVCTNLVWIWEA